MGSAVITAVLTISVIALAAGLVLAFVSRRLPAATDAAVDRVNELLPQTQCAQCGFPGCRPYAEAIVNDGADINLCPPGGDATVQRLARLLGREAQPVAVASGSPAALAKIDESLCIGCTHCREVCPVDAIVGAQQLMHTVIASECTGCELCVERCPVDCIFMSEAA
ncbi:MAG: electron transport complex subunit RsxB [Gammaproteobacteria bacterium]|nr:electron transport complex subunit RsxB [Gammaproteobacteria bacterium]